MKPIVYIALSQFCEKDQEPIRRLEAAGFDVRRNTLGRRLKYEEVVQAIGEADAVIAGVEPYDASILAALSRLRCISRCGVGTDAIDTDAAARHGIAILNTPDEVVEPAAQLTVAMIFALARNLSQYSADLRDGKWRRLDGHLLAEWTVGIVGFGRIGQSVEKYLRPFSPKIVIADPFVRRSDLRAEIELLDLPGLLRAADLVTLHASRREAEGPLLDAKAFATMRAGGRVVNTARGYLIDEVALYDALKSGHLAGAALDVFSSEPYAGPLLELPQVLCTPHIATLTRASRVAMEMRAAENVVTFLGQSS